jgi:nitrogen fixation/metabolism regulation signal transduction histidine kinase
VWIILTVTVTNSLNWQLKASLAKSLARIEANRQDIEGNRAYIESVETSLQTKASQTDVDRCVTLTAFERAITNTNREMLQKTDNPFTEALQGHVQSLEQRILEESERTSVAIKFVDWFTARGENYEHNIKIIDRHLRELVPSEEALKYSHLNFLEIAPK